MLFLCLFILLRRHVSDVFMSCDCRGVRNCIYYSDFYLSCTCMSVFRGIVSKQLLNNCDEQCRQQSFAFSVKLYIEYVRSTIERISRKAKRVLSKIWSRWFAWVGSKQDTDVNATEQSAQCSSFIIVRGAVLAAAGN